MAKAPALVGGFELPSGPRLPRVGSVDAVALEERAATLAKRSIKRESKVQALELAIRMMDLTTLEGQDTPGKVAAICSKAMRPDPVDVSVPPVAAVCVYPSLVRIAKERLAGSGVKVASVATAFPSGQSPTDIKVAETCAVVEFGADEVDMVIDRGAFLSGRYAKVFDEIVRVKEACGEAHLKVILETGELGTYDNVRRASLIAIAAGADFIKTSTGQGQPRRDAARDALHDGGRPRRLRGDRAHRRNQARRRDPRVEAGDPVPGHAVRDARRGVDDTRSLPVRRVLSPERRPHAATQGEDGAVPVRRLLHHRLMAQVEKRASNLPATFEWEYAPALEARDIVQIRERYGLFIGGEEIEPRTKEWFASISPSTEEPLFEVALAGEDDVALAVDTARSAFDNGWSELGPSERAKYLFRVARLIQERSRELAVAESLDGGKPIRESRDVDIPLAAAHFFYYAGWADKLEYAFPNRSPRPLGVAAQIIPWNFPLLMLSWKIAPALACGNTVVLKPAETTPLTAMIFADICRQAELPPGVVNLVTGDGTTGAHLVRNDGIDKLAFTGSTEVGKLIMRELAGRNVKLTLELGGKAANVVFDDAALDQAVEGIVNGIYFNQGHVCCAGSRLLVQESIYEPLLEKLKRRLSTLRVGDPLDKNTDVGAINSRAQLEKIRELVASGEEEGAEIYQPQCDLPERGYWFVPTLFTNVAQSYRIAQEEIFGPVLSVLTFRTPDEAVEKANNTPYGLSAGVWTEKGSRILWMAERLRAGVVWANTYNRFDPTSPFGGYRESGFGREGGRHGLEPYLRFDE